MSVIPALAYTATGLAVAGEVVTTTQSTGLLAPLIGGAASIVVAGIAAYSVLHRRRAHSPDDVNAITIARTTESNFATLRAETNARVDALADKVDGMSAQLDRIEDHVRPWPKADS